MKAHPGIPLMHRAESPTYLDGSCHSSPRASTSRRRGLHNRSPSPNSRQQASRENQRKTSAGVGSYPATSFRPRWQRFRGLRELGCCPQGSSLGLEAGASRQSQAVLVAEAEPRQTIFESRRHKNAPSAAMEGCPGHVPKIVAGAPFPSLEHKPQLLCQACTHLTSHRATTRYIHSTSTPSSMYEVPWPRPKPSGTPTVQSKKSWRIRP
mmetsp:Transcript_25581/g.51348  ORF Transcript_25581/g.51348 Transcript_25581/m.51348 type:complete len:209 (-) Transcript_25581:12-638(-)